MPNEDTVPVDRHVLLAMLDEAFIEAHKNLVAEFEKHTVDQIVEDLADSENVTSIFTKLRFFRE